VRFCVHPAPYKMRPGFSCRDWCREQFPSAALEGVCKGPIPGILPATNSEGMGVPEFVAGIVLAHPLWGFGNEGTQVDFLTIFDFDRRCQGLQTVDIKIFVEIETEDIRDNTEDEWPGKQFAQA